MLHIKDIVRLTNGKILAGELDIPIHRYSIHIHSDIKGNFYFPITYKGENREKYIIEAVQKGICGYMISRKCVDKEKIIYTTKMINPNISIIEVDEINQVLIKLASYCRDQNFNKTIIGVTGSVGKTSTCEFIANVLNEEENVQYSLRNENTYLNLARLLLELCDYEKAVYEFGIARPGNMELMSKLVKPDICVITNIGTAHLGNFKSEKVLLNEKKKIYKFIKGYKIIIINDDDEKLHSISFPLECKVIRYSIKEAMSIELIQNEIHFVTPIYGVNEKLVIHHPSLHNIYSALCAIKIGEALNINKENIIKGINSFIAVNHRFQIIEKNGMTIIDDTYNASFDSAKSGIITASKMKANRKILVLGDMLELGEFSMKLHQRIGLIEEIKQFDYIFTLGNMSQYIVTSLENYFNKENIVITFQIDELKSKLFNIIEKGDLIYLKASRAMELNKIVEELQNHS